ncbi:hypothetical protein F5884DRAFT_747292 [Xylogone sp. PMI_703]|nr:hypothetical protein F5884DRAFT_747292 [Xylogone sp. PMI_703]
MAGKNPTWVDLDVIDYIELAERVSTGNLVYVHGGIAMKCGEQELYFCKLDGALVNISDMVDGFLHGSWPGEESINSPAPHARPFDIGSQTSSQLSLGHRSIETGPNGHASLVLSSDSYYLCSYKGRTMKVHTFLQAMYISGCLLDYTHPSRQMLVVEEVMRHSQSSSNEQVTLEDLLGCYRQYGATYQRDIGANRVTTSNYGNEQSPENLVYNSGAHHSSLSGTSGTISPAYNIDAEDNDEVFFEDALTKFLASSSEENDDDFEGYFSGYSNFSDKTQNNEFEDLEISEDEASSEEESVQTESNSALASLEVASAATGSLQSHKHHHRDSKKKGKNASWSEEEANILCNVLRNLRDNEMENDAEPLRDNALWQCVSRRLQDEGIYRSSSACKGYWARYGQNKTKFDERFKPDPNNLVTMGQVSKRGKI